MDEWVQLVEVAMEAKAAGTKKADDLIADRRSGARSKTIPRDSSTAASAESRQDSAERTKSADDDAPKGLPEELKKMSPEERKQAIKERVRARREQKKKDKEL